MSVRDEGDATRRRLMAGGCRLSAVIALLGLAACGFHPLYGERGAASDPALASVRVEPIANRIGQILANQLRDGFNPTGVTLPTRYALSVQLVTSRREIGIRKDATATREQFEVVANYMLLRAADRVVLFAGSARATDAFDVIENDYSTTVAEQTSQERAMRVLGLEIQTRIALYLQGHPA
jgi:LPS-assembly lipoprotein